MQRLLPDEAAVGRGFHKGLHLSYPSRADAETGLRLGLIDERTLGEIVSAHETAQLPPQGSPLGGYIAIHGGHNPDEPFVWGTQGCVVLRNSDMDAVYDVAHAGMRVVIVP